MPRKILVAEDESVNRALLRNMLEDEYELLEAEDGGRALDILRQEYKGISAVLLDLVMPVRDGFEVLEIMRRDENLAQIPVIVASGEAQESAEVRAISLGANDFVSKPYNPTLILHCLRNAINLRETASMVNAIQRDKLTGLYNREAFFERAYELISSREAGYYIMSCLDIDNFKLINDRHGTEEGDRILRSVGKILKSDMQMFDGIAGRISADNFAVLFPASTLERGGGFLEGKRDLEVAVEGLSDVIAFSMGRYYVTDLSLSASAAYDRAFIAKQSVKGRYDKHIAYFDEGMRERLLREQRIIGEMATALEERQFEVWFQPQFNHASKALIGAEALVRWRHPERGLIAPAEFIPIFERNGFVYELDKYVWRSVCEYLRRWLDEGRKPLPASVNISRYDVLRADLIEVITGLVKEYDIPAELLKLEITESAFAKSSEQIIAVVKRLIECGFTLEIDDFGSGYSSLNTLKDVPANVLKLDMRFLESRSNSQRGGNILESIVRMAKWLDMSVIAEGVETIEQADFLKTIGCNYVQGYLYARPMPAAEYEALAADSVKEERLLALETVENLDNNSFWDPASMDTLIFNSYVGGACIFEYHNGQIELLRANDKYAQVIGSSGLTVEQALKLDWSEHLDAKNAGLVSEALRCSIETGEEVTEEFLFLDLPDCPRETYLRSNLRVIASSGNRYLVYCTNENITPQRKAEQKEREAAMQLETIMNNINGGVTASVLKDGRTQLLFANDQYFAQLGYTREQYGSQPDHEQSILFPEDIERVMREAGAFNTEGQTGVVVYRARRRDGSVRWIQSNISVISLPGVAEPVQLAVTNDITELREAEEKERMVSDQLKAVLDDAGSGITASVMSGGHPTFLLTNSRYYEILGFTKEQYEAEVENIYDLIHPDDRAYVYNAASAESHTSEQVEVEYRAIRRDGEEIWVRALLSSTRFTGVEQPVQLCIFTDITDEKTAERELFETDEQIKFLNDAAHDLLAQPDVNAGVDGTLLKLLDYFGGNRAYVFEFDYDTAVMSNTYEVCAEGVASEQSILQDVSMELASYWLHAFDERSFINIENVDALDDSRSLERQVLKAQGIKSLIAVPLRRDGGLLGFIGIDDPVRQQSGVSRLEAIGDYIAVMLTRRDLNSRIDSDSRVLADIMNDTPGGFVRMRINSDGSVVPVYFNDGFCKLVSMKRAGLMEIYGADAFAGVYPDDREIVREAVERMLERGEARSEKYRLLCGNGEYKWLRISGRRTTDESGETYLNIYYTDESEQGGLEEERRELLDNLPCGAALYEFDGEKLSAVHLNRRYRELVGREIPNPAEASVMEPVHPDDRAPLMAELCLAVTEKRDAECSVRILCQNSEYRLFHIVGRIIPKEDGKYAVYAAYLPVADDEASYQQMLPVALAAVMGSSTEISFVKDRNLHYICCSRAFAQMAGLGDEREVVGKTDYDFVARELADKYSDVDRAIIESGEPQLNYDETLPSPDGSLRYASTSKYPLMDAEGNVIGIYGVGRDVTEYRTAFERLKLLTDNIPGGIASFEVSPEGSRMLYFNEGFYKFSGYTREEFAQSSATNPLFLVFEEDIPRARAAIESVRSKSERLPDCVYRCHTKDGGFRWFNMKGMVSGVRGDTFVVNTVKFDITERREAEERLRVSEEQFRIAAALGDRTVARYDIKNGVYYNDSELLFKQGFGAEIPGAPEAFIDKKVIADSSVDDFKELYKKIKSGAPSATATVELRVPEGGFRWFRLDATSIYDADGQPSEAILVFFDVIEQREREAVYKKWQQSLSEKPLESYTLFRCNLSKNASFDSVEGSLLQIQFGDEAVTFNMRTMEYVEKFVYKEDRPAYIALLNSDALLANYYRGNRNDSLEYREIVSSDKVRWLRLTVELVEYPASTDIMAFLMYEDIDKAKVEELQTKELAETDPLTGVLNRAAFAERFNKLIAERKDGALSALLMFDLDGFKLINDSFGHAVGDQALIDMSKTLSSMLRQGDLVGRLGGDEFLVGLRDVPSKAVIGKKAKQICTAVRKSFSIEVQMSASLGIAISPLDGGDFETLYHKADIALYHIKATGKDSYAFYSEDMKGEEPRPEEGAAPPASSSSERDKLKRRMLIVEDDAINRSLLANIFKDDFIIDTADEGNSALIRLRRYGSGISVVLLDLIMPGMDGFAVLEKMRSSPEMQNIPVIVVSGMDERTASLKTIKCGASDFVTKPVDPDLLRLRVDSAVSKAENERLRAQNSFLALQSGEVARYRAVLESDGTVMAEYDAANGIFSYDKAVSLHIAGKFDKRPLWRVLAEDNVADAGDAERIRQLLEDVLQQGETTCGAVRVALKTPSGDSVPFIVKVIKRTDDFKLSDRLIVTFTAEEKAIT